LPCTKRIVDAIKDSKRTVTKIEAEIKAEKDKIKKLDLEIEAMLRDREQYFRTDRLKEKSTRIIAEHEAEIEKAEECIAALEEEKSELQEAAKDADLIMDIKPFLDAIATKLRKTFDTLTPKEKRVIVLSYFRERSITVRRKRNSDGTLAYPETEYRKKTGYKRQRHGKQESVSGYRKPIAELFEFTVLRTRSFRRALESMLTIQKLKQILEKPAFNKCLEKMSLLKDMEEKY